MSLEITNATISKTFLGDNERNLKATYIIDCDGDSDTQGFGCRYSGHTTLDELLNICRCVGADSWEALRKTHVRVARLSAFGDIIAIGHIIKDRWFVGATLQVVSLDKVEEESHRKAIPRCRVAR